jgi:hypothetical protein
MLRLAINLCQFIKLHVQCTLLMAKHRQAMTRR